MRFLVVICLLCSLSVIAQTEPDQSLPPMEILQQGEPGESLHIMDLPKDTTYKVFDVMGNQIDSGYGKHLVMSNYEPGTYFVRQGDFNTMFKQELNVVEENQSMKKMLWGGFGALVFLAIIAFYLFARNQRLKKELLAKIAPLQHPVNDRLNASGSFNAEIICAAFEVSLNESDQKIIEVLLHNPSVSNKDLADKVALSVEGVRSSLKKMYRDFDIPSSRNMRLALVLKIMQATEK